MSHPAPARGGGGMFGPHTSHFSIPGQFFLGFVFMGFGALLFLKMIGKDYLPIIPKEILIYIAAAGSVIGGFYLVVTHIWRPRLIF